jgi:hypothetical protein
MAESKKPQDLVNEVVEAFNASWNYRSASWHPKWQDMNKLYNSERVYVGYKGISDTFVPMSYSLVETMVAATSGDKPMVEYVPTKYAQNEETEVLNALFSYYWDLDQWTPKLIQHNRGLFKLGTNVLHTYWNIDHPELEVIPLRDFYCDPAATYFKRDNAAYMGHRFIANKKQLEGEMVINPDHDEKDPKSKALIPKYKNLDKLKDKYDYGDRTDKQEKDTENGSSPDEQGSKGMIEVICHETLDKIIYVGNREQVIYEHDNYFKERQQFLGIENPIGMFSYIIDSYSPDESQLYGKSVIDPIAKHQELLNDLTNQNIDAVSWSIDPEMELDPQYASYLGKMKSATGNIYPFKPGSYRAVQKPLLPTNVFNERTNIKNEIRETTAVDEITKGISASGADTTATEVKAQVAQSGRRFALVVSMLENGGYYQLAKLVFQMIQLYVTAPVMLRVIGEKGIDWKQFDPEMFKGDYEPRIKLQATLQDEKNHKMRDLKELYTAMLGNTFVNEEALTRYIIMKGFRLEPDEVEGLLKTKEEVAQEAQGKQGVPGKGEKPPEQVAMEGIAKNYANSAPDIQAQLEEKAGLQPSATHEGSMETAATQQMADQALHGEQIAPVPTTPPIPMTPGQNPQQAPQSGEQQGMMEGPGGQ